MKEFSPGRYIAKRFMRMRLGNGLDDSAKVRLDGVVDSIFRGEARSLSEDAEILLSGFPQQIDGQENIPRLGPGVIVVNHFESGPLWEKWLNLLVSREVNKSRVQNDTVHWLIQDSINYWLNIKREIPFTKEVCRRFANAYDLFLVKNPNVGGNSSDDAYKVMRIIQRVRRGGVIGLAPEAGNGKKLEGSWRAGALLYAIGELSKRSGVNVPLCPAAGWMEGNTLRIRFGETVDLGKFASTFEQNGSGKIVFYKDVADGVMGKISPLLQ